MRIAYFLPTFLVLLCAGVFFWLATEPVTLVQPTPLIRAAEDLVGAEDQSQYSKKLEIFRNRLYAEAETFAHTRETLLSYVVARDRAARRIPDPGFQTAILTDVLETSKKRTEDRTFRFFLLGGTLLICSSLVLFVQSRKLEELARVVRLEFPRESPGSVSRNVNLLVKALKDKAYLIEDLQGSIANLNSQLRQYQTAAQFQRQHTPGWNEVTLLMEDDPVPPQPQVQNQSDSFPSLSISQELTPKSFPPNPEIDPLDREPLNFFEEPQKASPVVDRAATLNLRQPAAVLPEPEIPFPLPEMEGDKSFRTGSPSQTSELLYTQFLLGLAESTNFPEGSQVFRIGVSKIALESLGRTYQDSQFGVRLFGFCVDRILTYFQLSDRTCLHFDEPTFILTFCVPTYLHGAVTEDEIESAFRTKAIYLSGIPVSLPDFQIEQYRA